MATACNACFSGAALGSRFDLASNAFCSRGRLRLDSDSESARTVTAVCLSLLAGSSTACYNRINGQPPMADLRLNDAAGDGMTFSSQFSSFFRSPRGHVVAVNGGSDGARSRARSVDERIGRTHELTADAEWTAHARSQRRRMATRTDLGTASVAIAATDRRQLDGSRPLSVPV